MDNREKNPAPIGLALIVAVVDRAKAEFYEDLLQGAGVNVRLTASALGTAKEETLRLFGITASEKAVIFGAVRSDRAKEALSLLAEKFKTVKNGKGVAFTVPFSSMIGVTAYRFLTDSKGEGYGL